jgi:hypothetical protein
MDLDTTQLATAEEAYDFFVTVGCTDAGIAGLLGNIYAESHLRANCVEELLLKRYRDEGFLPGWSSIAYDPANYERYMALYQSGKISREEFLSPRQYTGTQHQYGFGMAQWTTEERKKNLVSMAAGNGTTIDEEETQFGLIYYELMKSYPSVWRVLCSASSVREAAAAVLQQYECPADTSDAVIDRRTAYGEDILKIVKKMKGVIRMGIIFGSARIAEDGTVNGSQPGDNTGAEVSTQSYYKHRKGWKVLRANSAEAANKIASAMAAACANAHIGYSQARRYTGVNLARSVGWNPALIANACDVDCSSLVRVCVAYGTGKDPGDFDTGSERSALLATGLFSDVTWGINTSTGAGLCNGDILITATKGHTGVIVSGAGVRAANTSESTGAATAGQKGAYMFTTQQIYEGCPASNSVYLAQEILKARGLYEGALDKDFGPQTAAAVRAYQQARHLEVDAIVGPATWRDMIAL